MKNRVVLLATLVVIGSATRAVRGDEKTLTGKISDSLCGASHAAMAAKQSSKISDRDCVIDRDVKLDQNVATEMLERLSLNDHVFIRWLHFGFRDSPASPQIAVLAIL